MHENRKELESASTKSRARCLYHNKSNSKKLRRVVDVLKGVRLPGPYTQRLGGAVCCCDPAVRLDFQETSAKEKFTIENDFKELKAFFQAEFQNSNLLDPVKDILMSWLDEMDFTHPSRYRLFVILRDVLKCQVADLTRESKSLNYDFLHRQTFSLPCSTDCAGEIIGAKGVHLKKICNVWGCEVSIRKDVPSLSSANRPTNASGGGLNMRCAVSVRADISAHSLTMLHRTRTTLIKSARAAHQRKTDFYRRREAKRRSFESNRTNSPASPYVLEWPWVPCSKEANRQTFSDKHRNRPNHSKRRENAPEVRGKCVNCLQEYAAGKRKTPCLHHPGFLVRRQTAANVDHLPFDATEGCVSATNFKLCWTCCDVSATAGGHARDCHTSTGCTEARHLWHYQPRHTNRLRKINRHSTLVAATA